MRSIGYLAGTYRSSLLCTMNRMANSITSGSLKANVQSSSAIILLKPFYPAHTRNLI